LALDLKYRVKNALYRWTPGGFGHYRKLRELRDGGYEHARDKHPVREKHHGGGGWREPGGDSLRYRDYANYDEYLTHQVQKLDEMIKMRGGFSNLEIAAYRLKFHQRFSRLPPDLSRSARIVCLGARQGTEVEVLRDLGYNNAYGVDLNPGPANALVRVGDFMKLEETDGSIDMVYCNAIDHAFDLNAFFAEHARVLQPDGYALYDIAVQNGGAFESAEWDSEETVFMIMLRHFRRVVRVESEPAWKWVLLKGPRLASA